MYLGLTEDMVVEDEAVTYVIVAKKTMVRNCVHSLELTPLIFQYLFQRSWLDRFDVAV